MKKTVIYCSMNNLPDDIILHISGYLDEFHKIQLAYTCKSMRALIYNTALQEHIDTYIMEHRLLKTHILPFIRRINTDGVIYGECEQCFAKTLLYTHFDGESEKCICLDNCHGYCLSCSSRVTFHDSKKGCPRCYDNSDMWYLSFRI